mgnify:CR=1 FL=1
MLSAALQKKIIAIAKALPSLKKEDSNNTYNYVSIDAYYEGVAKKCIEAGLNWFPSELGIGFQEGPDGLIQVQQYGFTLYDSETGDIAENAIKLTISHPFQEAQTTGSSLSYAEKLLMRVLFKVVTGEKDADANAPKKRGRPAETVEVENPFKEEATNDNDEAPPQPATSKKVPLKRGPKPKVTDENSAQQEMDAVTEEPEVKPQDSSTADAIMKLDEPPWVGDDKFSPEAVESVEGGAVDLYDRTATDLIAKIEKCKSEADLTQFKLDETDAVTWLKNEAGKDASPNKALAVAARDKVAAVFRAKYVQYNSEDAA